MPASRHSPAISGLRARAFLPELGESRVVDDGRTRAALHRQPICSGSGSLRTLKHDHVGRLRQVGQARIADVIGSTV